MATANIKAVITAEDRASGQLKRFGGNVGGIGSKIATVAKSAAVALGVATAAAVTFGVKTASEFQQSRVSFETMLGSADKARTTMVKLSKFAEKTPFDLPQVVDGAKRLLAYNIEAEKLIPTFSALGNIAAGVGKDKLPQLILAFGQVRAAGKLTGQELRQFTEAGVPLLELLAKQSGKTAGEIKQAMEDGAAPSFEEVEKAVFSASKEGGKFFNLMEKQSKTLGGTLSNLRDVAVRTLSEIVGVSITGEIRKGSLFDVLQQGAKGLLDYLNSNKAQIMGFFERLGEELGRLWARVQNELIPALTTLWKEVIAPLIPVIGVALVLAIDTFISALTGIVEWINNNQTTFWALVGVFVAFKAALAINKAVLAFTGALAVLRGSATLTTTSVGGIIGKVKALKLLLASPIGTITILGFAAVAAWFAYLSSQISKLRGQLDVINRRITAEENRLKNSVLTSKGAAKTKSQVELYKYQKETRQFQLGGRNRSGGMVRARAGMRLTRVGEEGAENVMLPVGSQVQRNIDTKLSGGQTINNFNFNVGMYMGTAVERRKAAQEIWKDLIDIASRHGTTPAKMLGI